MALVTAPLAGTPSSSTIGPGIARPAAIAVAMGTFASMASRVLSLAGTLLLARLLSPVDFGVANVGAFVLMVLLPLTDIGIARVLVRAQPTELQKRARTAFWMIGALGAALYLALYLTADVVATVYRNPAIGATLRVVGISIVLYAISRIPSALLERELRQGRRALPDIAASFAYAIAAVALAYLHFGYWSIVIATVARFAVLSIGLFWMAGWGPPLRFDLDVAQELIAYARILAATSMLRLIYTNLDNAIVGAVLGVRALGFYAIAYSLGNLAAIQVAGALGAVLYPAYTRMLPDFARIRQAALRMLRYVGLLILPLTTISALATPAAVPLVLGSKWIALTAALQILLVYGCFHTLGPIYWSMLMANDDNLVNLRINLVSLTAALLTAVPVASRYGITGVAAEFTLLEFLRLASMAWAVRSRLNLSLTLQCRAVAPALAGSLISGAIFSSLAAMDRPTNLATLAAEIIISGAAYAVFLFGTRLLTAREVVTATRHALRRAA